MMESYTQEACNRIFDLLDKDIAAIWEDIRATPMDTPADRWKKKLERISEDYSFSSRFALMRILYSRAAGADMIDASGVEFEAYVQGKLCRFQNISMAHAKSLTPEENTQYITLLLEIAGLQADSDPEVDEWIISRAWYDENSANAVSESMLSEQIHSDEKKMKKARSVISKENKAKYKTRLTREEALQLGHILDFSLAEMEWYLLRVFDTGDCFRFNQSDDLIEAYGFLTGASWQQVAHLKERYAEICAGIEKADASAQSKQWTQDVSESLVAKVESWKQCPDTRDDQFLSWMKSHTPGLDRPSCSAARIYRNLAIFAYDLILGEECFPDEENFLDSIQDVCGEAEESGAVHRHLYHNGVLSIHRCKSVADALLLENKIQSASIQADNAKAWHVLTTRGDGSLSASGGIVNTGRTRVADILAGKLQAEKGDMLYLLWFTANLVWQSADPPDTNALCCRVLDFMDAAQMILEAALLPEFYPPHPMEQSMLLSIVQGGGEQEDSSVVYEYMLYALTEHRKRTQGSKRHDLQFKIDVVTYYRAHKDLTLEECARQFGISPQSLSAWQKDLLKKGNV